MPCNVQHPPFDCAVVAQNGEEARVREQGQAVLQCMAQSKHMPENKRTLPRKGQIPAG